MEFSIKITNFKIFMIFAFLIMNLVINVTADTYEGVLTDDDPKRNTIIMGCSNLVYSRLNYDPVKWNKQKYNFFSY